MNINIAFETINWLSVVVATLSAFALGSLWYSPILFTKAWQKEAKLSDDDLKGANMPLIFGTTFVLQFISATVLDLFIGPSGTWSTGLIAGSIVGVAWIATAFGTSYLFSRKSLKLYFIDAGYFVVYFLIMGLILGAWK